MHFYVLCQFNQERYRVLLYIPVMKYLVIWNCCTSAVKTWGSLCGEMQTIFYSGGYVPLGDMFAFLMFLFFFFFFLADVYLHGSCKYIFQQYDISIGIRMPQRSKNHDFMVPCGNQAFLRDLSFNDRYYRLLQLLWACIMWSSVSILFSSALLVTAKIDLRGRHKLH